MAAHDEKLLSSFRAGLGVAPMGTALMEEVLGIESQVGALDSNPGPTGRCFASS